MNRFSRPAWWGVLALVLALSAACGANAETGEGASGTETPSGETDGVSLIVSNAGESAEVRVEVAETQAERSQGLMGRTELGEDAGMLFLFGGMVRTPFWMKNTYVALDIAFLGEDGTVKEIREGVPESEDLLQPALPYLYVLELNRGWFERHGFGPGAVVTIPEALRDGGTP